MSATLIHHGHVRILQKAKEHGYVIVALTTDDEIISKKGYVPELTYEQRKEVLESIRYVDEVVPSKWLLDEAYLDQHKVDLLVHGHDNSNQVNEKRLLILPRTNGISSTLLRSRVLDALSSIMKKESKDL